MENEEQNLMDGGKAPILETTTESLKLIKNTKGYNWEIKILSIDLERLKKINDQMIAEYGSAQQ